MSDGEPGPTAPRPPSPWASPDQAVAPAAPQQPPAPQQAPAYGQPPYGQAPFAPSAHPPYGAPTDYPAYGPPAGQLPGRPTGRPRMLPWILGAVAGVLVLVLTGVGLAVWSPWSKTSDPIPARTSPSSPADPSSSSEPGGAAADPANQSWLLATNAYCRGTTDPELKAASPLSKTDPATYFERNAAITRELDTLLRKNPPAGLRSQVEEIATHWDEMADLLDQAAAAIRDGDRTTATQLLDESDTANQLGNDLAKQIGLPDCADAGGIGVTPSPTGPGTSV